MKFDCEFLFAALAEKHNVVIHKIREIPPWEWGGEFLELEPKVLRFLGTFAKRYPECAAFRTAHTLASALAVYRLGSRKPKTLTKQERAICIAANRDLVDEYSDAFLRAYTDIFRFLLKTHGGTALDAATAIIETIKAEHNRTRQKIEETERRFESWKDGFLALLNPVVSFIKWVMPKFKTRERGGEITQEQVARDFGVSRATVNRWEINIHVTGSNLNKADRLQIRFYATNGEDHSFDFGEHMIVSLEDNHWVYRGQWLYDTMRTICEESGCVLDMIRGGQIELTTPSGVLAFRSVTFDI